MRVLVTADTHVPRRSKKLPDILLDACRQADHILHAGDLVSAELWHTLSQLAPITAVAGNNDLDEFISCLPKQVIVQFEQVRIGMLHGHFGPGRSAKERAWRLLSDAHVDVIVFGHSHQPYMEQVEGILLLNPGSPTDRRRHEHYSFVWLTIEESDINVEWVRF